MSNGISTALKKAKSAIRRQLLRSRDFLNIARYGPAAPRYAERIWVEPHAVRYALHGPGRYIVCSGQVAPIGQDLVRVDLRGTPRISSCLAHWVHGVPWVDTLDYQVTLNAVLSGKNWAQCSTEQDLIKRYEQLDRIFEEAKVTRRLKTRSELDRRTYREEGGVLICLDEHGEPLLYDGFHRFAIALVLELPIIPAQLGYVARSALPSLNEYRRPPVDAMGETS
jgi:hypothetical protein